MNASRVRAGDAVMLQLFRRLRAVDYITRAPGRVSGGGDGATVHCMDELLPLLPTLISVARTGSVSQSARVLGVPRSTVTRRLARIESAVGFAIVERSSRRFLLTRSGRRLVEGAVEALARLETVHEQARAEDSEVSGVLRIAIPVGIAGAFGGWFFALLNARLPLVKIELTVTDHRTFRLEEGRDLVVVMGNLQPSQWLRRRMGDTEMLAVASPRYLGHRGTPTTIAALDEHLLLTWADLGGPTWPRLSGGDFPVQASFATNDFSMLRDLAITGMGIALVPWHLVVAELAAGSLVRVLPTLVGQTVEINALYVPERRASPVLKAVLAVVAEFAKEQPILPAAQSA